jgi:plastocyanin domain-containing protein
MKSLVAAVSFVSLISACSKPAAAPPAPGPASGNRFNIPVDGSGYHPSTVNVHAGQATTLVFTRTSDEGCGQQVVFPSLSITRDLPLNQPVEVQVTPTASAPIAFTCGMAMYRGSVVAR